MPKQLPDLVRRLVAFRGKHNLSREAVARALGVSASTVYRWEKGRCVPTGLARQHLEAYLSEKESA
jgi:DNA-binding transcriptional regulator YiaG